MIDEQISRSLSLMSMIPTPPKFKELKGLSNTCGIILNKNIKKLKNLKLKLKNSNEQYLNYFFRKINNCYLENSKIEAYGISALYYETKELGYFNKLIHKICNEIHFPFTPPSIACISMDYYFYYKDLDVIFVPLGEAKTIIHIPNLIHELGHYLLTNIEKFASLKIISESKNKIVKEITNIYTNVIQEKKRLKTPSDLLKLIKGYHYKWKNYWINEIFSDIFSVCTIGPAYVYSFFHLVTKELFDYYEPKKYHPPDFTRLSLLITTLKKLGYVKDSDFLSEKIEHVLGVLTYSPDPSYYFSYTDELLNIIPNLFIATLKNVGIEILENKVLEKSTSGLISILNHTWKIFWLESHKFFKWEKEAMLKIKNILEL